MCIRECVKGGLAKGGFSLLCLNCGLACVIDALMTTLGDSCCCVCQSPLQVPLF